MTDYNLGRASGEISIAYDSRGLREAQADMAGTAAEAAALDAAMGRVNRSFDDNREKTHASAEEIVRARGEVDELRRAYKQYQDEYEQAQRVRQDAEERARDVIRDQSHDLDSLREARIALTRAQEEEQRLQVRAAEGLQAYHDKMAAVRLEVDKFNRSHVEATSGFRNMRVEAEKMGEAVESLTEKLSGVARVLGQAGLFGLFGGASAGSLFATGAGGLNILAVAMGAVVETAEAFVGAMALIPAGVNAAALSLGSLAVAFHGVGAALSSLENPAQFVQDLKKVSPTMQQVLITVQSFTEAFRGAKDAVQESFAQQIIRDIQPLITTWLPLLMNAGKQFATQWGQAFHQVFEIFNTPQAQAGFKEFVSNAVQGFQAARGAIQPLITAWNTLASVGSQLFGRLGNAITNIATQFNNWIQRTAASGELFNFMSKALDAFTNIGRTVRDLALSIHNIFSIFQGGGPGALQTIANLAEKFRAWTESVKGQQGIASFFNLLQAAGTAITPVIKLLGDAISVVAGTLTRLGIAIGPGLTSFFTSFTEALRQLSPFVIQLAPAINAFLEAFGQTLLQIVQTLGPKLPQFFQEMSDAFVQLLQLLPPMADLLGKVLDHLTSDRVEALLGLVAAFKLLGITLAVLSANPITLVAAAIAGLVAGTILLVDHFGGLSGTLEALSRVWDSLTGAIDRCLDALAGSIRSGWDTISNGLSELGSDIGNFFIGLAADALDWGANLIHNLVQGMRSVFGVVGDAASDLVGLISDHIPRSPAKKGPFADASPEQLGQRLVLQYAGGMISGRPAIASASADIAGSASAIGAGATGAGFGSQSFSSGGVAGKSGQDFSQGNSGFDQWVGFITKDLSAWNNIFQESFNLVGHIADIVTKTVRVAANLMNGGDNALTRPGGLAGPPLPIAQQVVPGVENKQIPGVAPDKWGRDLAAKQGLPGQQGIPGVPTVNPNTGLPTNRPDADPNAAPPPPADNTGAAPANPPASTTGQAPAGTTGAVVPGVPEGTSTIPLTQNPDGTWTSPNPEWAKLIQRESSGDPKVTQHGYTDANTGGNEATGLFQIAKGTWQSNGGLEFAPNAKDATPQQQAIVAARIFNAQGGHPWGSGKNDNFGRENEGALRAGLTRTGPPAPPPAAPVSVGAPTASAPGKPGIPDQQKPYNIGEDVPYASGISVAGYGAYKLMVSGIRGAIQKRRDNKAAAGEATDAEDARLAMTDDDLVSTASPQERVAATRGSAPSPADINPTDPIRPAVTGPATAPDSAPTPTPRATPVTPDVPIPTRGPLAGLGFGAGVSFGLGVLAFVPATMDTLGQINKLEEYQRAVSEGRAAPITEDELSQLRQRPGLLTDENVKRLGGINTAPGVRPITAGDIGGTPNLPTGQVDPHSLATAGKPIGAPTQPGPPPPAPVPASTTGATTGPGRYGAGFTRNPASRAGTLGGAAPAAGSYNKAYVQSHGIQPLYTPGEYEYGDVRLPQWARDLASSFNLKVGSSVSESGSDSLHGSGNAFDFQGSPEDMDRFADWAQVNLGPQLLELIHVDTSGRRVGVAGGVNVGPGTSAPGYFSKDWAKHGDHVHIATDVPILQGGQVGAPQPAADIPDEIHTNVPIPSSIASGGSSAPPRVNTTGQTGQPGKPIDTSQMKMPPGWDLNQPVPLDVRRAHGIPDNLPPIYYPAEPGTVQNVPAPAGSQPGDFIDTPDGRQQVSPGGTISLPTTTGSPVAGFPSTNDQRTPLDKISQGFSDAASIAGDGFKIFGDVIKDIGAAANMTNTLVRGFANTEDIVGFIQQIQPFLETGADVAKLVGDIGGIVAGAGSADPTGGAGAAGAGVQAIASIVGSAFEAANEAITLGIDIYHEVGKYAGFIFGEFLGGANTGPLGGNVRMLLNTKTNQLQTYSENNALNKNIFDVPLWQQSYAQQPNTQQNLPPQVNFYAGPGQSPQQFMSDSMFAATIGSAAVASVAGAD